MLALSSDTVIGRSLRIYGEWAEHELNVLHSYVVAGTTVVDVGANIGTHTLPMSRWVDSGHVISIEAQPVISRILRINCLQNACFNVRVFNAICADNPGNLEMHFGYSKEFNYGAVSFAQQHSYAWRRLCR